MSDSATTGRRRRSAARVLAVGLPTLVLLLIGYVAGRWSALQPLRRQVDARDDAATLGDLIGAAERRGMARTFHDPEAALSDMDSYSWEGPKVMAPFVGHACRPGRAGGAVVNADLCRSSHPIERPKPTGVLRVFLTGGSTAYSIAAPDEARSIGGYLERALTDALGESDRRVEVFTMACPAWASTHERIMIENRLVELEPDLVISLTGNNDVHWGMLGRDVLWFRSYTDEALWRLMNTALEICGVEPMIDVTTVEKHPVDPALVVERFQWNIRLARHALRLRQIPYLVFLQPTLAVTGKGLTAREKRRLSPMKDYFRACYAAMRERLAALPAEGFAFHDLTGVFDHLGSQEEIFLDSYHFGDKGNELIARAMVPGIISWLRPR